jgi:hypothetical protein
MDPVMAHKIVPYEIRINDMIDELGTVMSDKSMTSHVKCTAPSLCVSCHAEHGAGACRS